MSPAAMAGQVEIAAAALQDARSPILDRLDRV
jgi:hypothetical protein